MWRWRCFSFHAVFCILASACIAGLLLGSITTQPPLTYWFLVGNKGICLYGDYIGGIFLHSLFRTSKLSSTSYSGTVGQVKLRNWNHSEPDIWRASENQGIPLLGEGSAGVGWGRSASGGYHASWGVTYMGGPLFAL